MFRNADILHMRRAVRLAVLGRETAPNPMVGCVIVDASGVKAGEGYHVRPGEPHAEVHALRQAGERARGGTAFVTLEPCSHHGRTPPCADALVAAGIARVVVAMTDPDSRVSGQGIERLRAAGVVVETGLCGADARRLNEAYIKHRTTGMPWVTIKAAMSLDGKIATRTGDSRWITSPVTRLWAHRQLRARYPAILMGIGTVLADDPELTVRLRHRPHARNPLRVIVDTHLRTPLDARVVQMGARDGKTLIAHASRDQDRILKLTERGACLIDIDTGAERVDPAVLLRRLGTDYKIIGVLVEGGAQINASLYGSGLVDRYIATIGPVVIGGQSAPGPVGGEGAARMADALRAARIDVRRSGPDVVLDCRFEHEV